MTCCLTVNSKLYWANKLVKLDAYRRVCLSDICGFLYFLIEIERFNLTNTYQILTSNQQSSENFYGKWTLTLNTNKTESSCFHFILNNLGNRQLSICFNGNLLKYNCNFKHNFYLQATPREQLCKNTNEK